MVMFSLEIYGACERAYVDKIVLDLREGKIYFAHWWDDVNSNDYIDFKPSAELSEEEIAAIRKELPEHIEENYDGKERGEFHYSLTINMLADDGTRKYFQGYGDNEERFPGMGEYWKGLYKKYYGKEYEFTTTYPLGY